MTYNGCNGLGSLKLPQLQIARVVTDGLTNQSRRLGLSLRLHDLLLPLLLRPLHQEHSPLRLLLRHLLGLHGRTVLGTEAQLRDGHVIQDDVEVFGPLDELRADQGGHLSHN